MYDCAHAQMGSIGEHKFCVLSMRCPSSPTSNLKRSDERLKYKRKVCEVPPEAKL